jgi:hypothetical protein
MKRIQVSAALHRKLAIVAMAEKKTANVLAEELLASAIKELLVTRARARIRSVPAPDRSDSTVATIGTIDGHC